MDGSVYTPGAGTLPPVLAGRDPEPLDVARVCLFLSSELSDGMTGQILNVDAGWVMH